jgi:hypothetical protein
MGVTDGRLQNVYGTRHLVSKEVLQSLFALDYIQFMI